MNFNLEARHWMIMIGAVILAAAAMILIPKAVAVYPAATYAFPILAAAMVIDTLGTAAERHKAILKLCAWLCLCAATSTALMPLGGALNGAWTTIQEWTDAGWSLHRALVESLMWVAQYPESQKQAMMVSVGLGASTAIVAIWCPVSAFLRPDPGQERNSADGPWTACWMDPSDIAYLRQNKTGLPLALHRGKILRYMKNDAKGWRGGHHLVVSGTRGGKGVSTVIPAILDHDGPVVALDIKGENFAITRRHREELGRKVAVLNPFGIIEDCQDQFNPLDYIRPTELARDIALVADGLVKPEEGDGAHFSEMARQLVAAAIEVVVMQETECQPNLVTVADLLLSSDLDLTLEEWVKERDVVGHRPADTAATMLRAGDRERGSIQTSVAKAFGWMQSEDMRRFLQRSSFKMDDLLDDKLDLFIVVPLDQVDRQAVFMRLFVNLVLGTVVRQDGKRKVKAPILMVLDEFVRLGRMEQIMNIANVAAGAGIEALFVTQDTGQVERAYGDNDARSIFGSCITKRVFNVNDIETAEWASRHLGESTVLSRQVRQDGEGYTLRDASFSEQGHKLMTATQIMGMKADDVLLLVGNRNPLKAKQNLYFKSKAYRGRWDRNPLN